MPPLTSKGSEVMKSMQKTYGSEQGKRVFYASRNAGKISGVDQGRINPHGHYLRVGGAFPKDRIKGPDLFKAPGNDIQTNTFVPGGGRARR